MCPSNPVPVEYAPDVDSDLCRLFTPYRGYSLDWLQRLRRGELTSPRPARLVSLAQSH